MYWFGEEINKSHFFIEDQYWSKIELLKKKYFETSLHDILSLLNDFANCWNEEGELFQKAFKQLVAESQMSLEEVRQTLLMLKPLLAKENLLHRLRAEFNPLEQLDRFAKPLHFQGEVRAVPLGVILHVTAGNVFLSSIDSLVMGLITKNLSIIKVSGQNLFFPLFFARALFEFDKNKIIADKFAILHWKGGDQKTETYFKQKVDGIIAWGGEEMVKSYSQNLDPETKLLKFGPKISIQVISQNGLRDKNLKDVAAKIVEDIIPWDQSACSSPQNLYLEEGIDIDQFIEEIKICFDKKSRPFSPSSDVSVEILKEQYRAEFSELMEEGRCVKGSDYLIHFEKNKFLRPSPLNRSIIIKIFSTLDDLSFHLKPFTFYLQSCSYLLGEDEKYKFLDALSFVGIKRFATLGTVTSGMYGAPHDGVYVLRELVKFIGNEERIFPHSQALINFSDSQSLKNHFESLPHPKGYIFSSGGTTGEPKYVHFSFEEFDFISDLLAFNLKAQGIRPGMVVANLFVAGNMWSSFIAIDRALEKIGAINLPIGGLCQEENIVMYLKRFKPDVVLGIPSLLIMNAEYSLKANIDLSIPMILYAGELLSESRRKFLEKTWKTRHFGSAGYASVDAGVIGYQCKDCSPGEHHLFSEFVQMQIIDDQAVVTSSYRKSMPIMNYKTGDRVEWVDNHCSFGDKKFKLLGRMDTLIQIWSTRINLEDISRAIEDEFESVKTFQIILKEEEALNKINEILEIHLEEENFKDKCSFAKRIYLNSRDLKDTISFEQFEKNLKIVIHPQNGILRNPRTGKISLIKDLRL
jgi:phenylacetate-CoA ligase